MRIGGKFTENRDNCLQDENDEEEGTQEDLLEEGLEETIQREEEEEGPFLPLAIKEQTEEKEEVKVGHKMYSFPLPYSEALQFCVILIATLT
jgi:hypothetical protein